MKQGEKQRQGQGKSTGAKGRRRLPRLPGAGESGEAAWIDVIRKMDEVYAQLLEDEVELERKNAALEASQQFSYSVLTSMSDVLVVCDRNGLIQETNDALVQLTGMAESELRRRPFTELLADEPSRLQAGHFLERLHHGPINDCELEFRDGDGGVPVAVNCTARHDTGGRLVGMVLIGRPVGELRRAYRALREAHEELKRTQQQLVQSEKMASLGRLVAGVAHELNNPISFVLGNVHAMQRYGERLQTYLEAVHRGAAAGELAALRQSLRIDRIMEDLKPMIEGTIEGAERTRDIVDGLKRFSAVDRNEEQQINLTEIVERSVHWVTKAASGAFKVRQDLPETVLVNGSAGQLQQVVINLVQNAYDATAGQPAPWLEISGETVDGEVRLVFHDNGPGIEPTYLDKVFDPFFTTKSVGKGTGLGLSISYGIIERHGGRLEAGNHPQGGAVFNLRLPTAAR